MCASLSNSLLSGLFAVEAGARLFCDEARIQAMLEVEAGLARTEGRLGIIPAEASEVIASCCKVGLFDLAKLGSGLATSGNLAIPLVNQLTALVRERSPEAAGYVHWGATSQDILDTGLVLQLRQAFEATEAALGRVSSLLASICREHAATPMAGRTWMQQAVPVTLGLKAAGWLSALGRDRERLAQMRERTLTVQFGGAAGTLASLGERGLKVAAALAAELGLATPDSPWHGARDRMAEVGTVYGILSGTLAKIGRDLSLLMQTEIGEVAEGAAAGRGGSSTMPHKRNPVGTAALLACTQRMPGLVATMLCSMAQENERGLGNWGSEWGTLPEICELGMSAMAHLEGVLTGLEVDPDAMRRNLEATHGLLFAESVSMRLAPKLGRYRAHALLQTAAKQAVLEGLPLRAVVAADPVVAGLLTSEELEALFQAEAYLGSTPAMIARVLLRYEGGR